jgi:carbon monoxide dehydrogenase subunit G
MASIRREIPIAAPPEDVWKALRDVGNAHRVFRGVLVDCRLEEGARVVTFANGLTIRELIVDLDDAARRFSWAAVGGKIAHHNASLQVFADAEGGGSRVVWIADVLPDAASGDVAGLMEQGAASMKRTLDRPLPP